MLVIDYLRQTKDNAVATPSFHRGHLGFMPDTPVCVALMTEPAPKSFGCEVFITTFNSHTANLFKLSCILSDEPGAVDRVVSAVSSLNLNIVLQESACINHLRHHVTNMMLDWTQSEHPERRLVPQEQQRSFASLSEVLPPEDFRYFVLYERLVKFCGDILEWQPSRFHARELPAITIAPFEARRHFIESQSTIHTSRVVAKDEQGESMRSVYSITIPEKILDRVREETRYGTGERIPYIIASDTTTRTLRVFFLRRGIEESTVHIAFSHRNHTGALSTITNLLARSNFNILTSILRREDDVRNTWEVLLHYRGPAKVPAVQNSVDQARWAKEQIDSHAQDNRGVLRQFGVFITTPRYPRSKYDADFREPLFSEDDEPSYDVVYPMEESFQRTLAKIRQDPERRKREWVLSLFDSERQRPKIFYSYPATACLHVALLKEALGKHFECDEYQDSNAEDITQSVIEKIEQSDYFLAIWHPEAGRPTEISPWMPFEFGIASVLGKKSMIVVANTIDERNWRRINPNISRHRYSDTQFALTTVPAILEFATKHWL